MEQLARDIRPIVAGESTGDYLADQDAGSGRQEGAASSEIHRLQRLQRGGVEVVLPGAILRMGTRETPNGKGKLPERQKG